MNNETNSNATEIFAKRLKELRLRKDLSLKKLACDLDVTAQSLSLYETGQRTVNIDLLKKISEYFGVSSDYLIGLSDAATNDVDLKAVCDYLGLYEGAALRLQQINKRLQKKDSKHQCPQTTNECYKQCLNIFINEYLDDFLIEILDDTIDLFYLEKRLKKLNNQLDNKTNMEESDISEIFEELKKAEENADFRRYQAERTTKKILKDYMERINWGFMLIKGNTELLGISDQDNTEEASNNGNHNPTNK